MSSAKDRRRARRAEKRRQECDQLSQHTVESSVDSASLFRVGVITSLVLVAATMTAPPIVQRVAVDLCDQSVEIVHAPTELARVDEQPFSWAAPHIHVSPEIMALARVEALERVLLRDLDASITVQRGHRLHGLEQRLRAMVYCADAKMALRTFALGLPYMMAMSEDLAMEPLADPFEQSLSLPGSFVFYEDIDGELIPTPEAIDAWAAVHYRLVRKISALSKMLHFSVGEAPGESKPNMKNVA